MKPVVFIALAFVLGTLWRPAIATESPVNYRVMLSRSVRPPRITGAPGAAVVSAVPIPWQAVSTHFPTTLPVLDPERREHVALPVPGLYLVTFVVTYNASELAGMRKAHLEICEPDRCVNAFDGAEGAAVPGSETTLPGSGFVRSTGATTLRLLTLHDQPGEIKLSPTEYETHLHIHRLAD